MPTFLSSGSSVLALTLALLASGISAANAAPPDFTGVWQPVNPPLALRTTGGMEPPLLPEAKASYDQRKAMAAKGDFSFDRSHTKCAPPGEPRIMTEDAPFDIFQTRTKLLFGYQWNRLLRYINLDKKMDVISPFYFGTSVGHFDGSSLKVDAQGFNDKFFLDRSGMPHSDQLELTEEFTLGAAGATMAVRIHVKDPKTFSKEWETTLKFKKLPGARITEDICTVREKLIPKDLAFFDAQE